MELKEMIKVMQHYEDGGVVEFSEDNFKTIHGESNSKNRMGLSWDWARFLYRIKEPKQKVNIEKWLCQERQGDFTVIESSNIDSYIYAKKIKLIESYEVELWNGTNK